MAINFVQRCIIEESIENIFDDGRPGFIYNNNWLIVFVPGIFITKWRCAEVTALHLLRLVNTHVDSGPVADDLILTFEQHEACVKETSRIISVEYYALVDTNHTYAEIFLQFFYGYQSFTCIATKAIVSIYHQVINSAVMLADKTVEADHIRAVKVACAVAFIYKGVNDLHVIALAPLARVHVLAIYGEITLPVCADAQISDSSF